VSALEDRLATFLSPLISQSTHVLAPWEGDFHPDHEVCGRVAAAIAWRTGARLSWYFFWTWHRGTPATLEKRALRRFPLDAALQQTKSRALRCHVSQLHPACDEPILPANLPAPAARSFQIFAEL
jgi:LmbE family N-acetylglucosaminyl deacetylase